MTRTPAVEGWFTTGSDPALLGSRCVACESTFFPPVVADGSFCRNPACSGETFATVELSRRGRIWSYTDAQYQPPPPYIPVTDPFEPFALAAVELAEGLVVLGQVATGFGVADLTVGDEVDLVVETLYVDDEGEHTTWRWKPASLAGSTRGSAA